MAALHIRKDADDDEVPAGGTGLKVAPAVARALEDKAQPAAGSGSVSPTRSHPVALSEEEEEEEVASAAAAGAHSEAVAEEQSADAAH